MHTSCYATVPSSAFPHIPHAMLVTVRALALPHIRHDDDDDDEHVEVVDVVDVVDVEFGDDVGNETTVKFRLCIFKSLSKHVVFLPLVSSSEGFVHWDKIF